ncbi:MAG: hypothetical protein WC828_09840 [Thermoleophilia bacterium]|jgi:hypothetical protein
MKKTLAIFAALSAVVVLAIISGCGTQASSDSSNLSSEKYAQINIGMTADQVKSLAGEPSRTEAKNMSGGHSMGGGSMSGDSMNMEYWYFQGSKGWVRLEMADGKVTAKSGY